MRTLALDVETTKAPFLHPWQEESSLVAVGLADESGWKRTWVFNHNEATGDQSQREMIDEIQAIILTADRLVGHNLKFDLNWIRALGIHFGHAKLFCTQVTEYLLRSQHIGQLKLSDLSRKYLSIEKIDRVQTMWEAGYDTPEIPLRILLPYLEQDCINALAIFQRQVPLIKAEGMTSLAAVLNNCGHILSEIETNGMLLDKDEAMKHITAMQLELQVLDTELKLIIAESLEYLNLKDYEINLDSRDELSAYLYGGNIKTYEEEWVMKTLKSKPETVYRPVINTVLVPIKGLGFKADDKMKTKKKGVYQVGKDVIKYLPAKTKKQKEVKKLLAKRSGTFKALSSLFGKDETAGIFNKVQVDGLVHPQYNQTIAITGRLTSSDPNGQNLPREGTSPVKLSFVARNDYILEVDLSQIEWRVVAWLSQDQIMIQEILDGVDPHTENAIKFFGGNPADGKKFDKLRTTAKIMTFRLIYGGSAYSFYMDSKMPKYSLKKWDGIVKAFYAKYKGLAKWQAENIRKVFANGGWLKNPTGRKFTFIKGPKGYRPQQIKNYPVQSLATADVMPVAMLAIYNRFKKMGFDSLIIGQVHDALIFDAHKHEMEDIAKMCIEEFEKLPEYINQLWPNMNFDLPLTGDAEYGKSWGNLTKLKLAA
jgi:DNA polymerase I-like protein with 3'-5' exonuclease and polymerase domains